MYRSLSKLAQSIPESGTLKLNAEAKALIAQGESVINLGGGEPKSLVPLDSVDAVNEFLKKREVRYSPAGGLKELKEAIIDYTKEYYNQEVELHNIIVSAGAKQSLNTCLKALLNPGEEVIIIAPYWVSYPQMIKICRGVPVIVKPKNKDFHPTIEEIARKVNRMTKAIVINTPTNPTGVMYSEEFIKDIVHFCEVNDIYLIMDDIYHRLLFDDKKVVSSYKYVYNLDAHSKIVVINGISKQYAMTGFRIGWAIANRFLTGVMTKIQGHETSGASTVSQVAAIAAIKSNQYHVDELRILLEENRNILIEELKKLPKARAIKPDGTFYCFVDFSQYEKKSRKLSRRLLDEARVVAVPGIEFGMDGYLRISTCGSKEDIIEGIRRIKEILEPEEVKIDSDNEVKEILT